MWKEVADYGTHDDKLWLVIPNFPDELPVIWLVQGVTPDHVTSITIPIKRDHLSILINELTKIESVLKKVNKKSETFLEE